MVSAKKWLGEYLSDGKPHAICEIREDAKAVGLLKSDLRDARKAIGHVITESSDNPMTGMTDWFWRLA